MKKTFPLFCAGMLSVASLQAQNPVVFSSPEVPIEYAVTAVSPNGKWACGTINDGYYRAFRWNLVTNELIELSPQGETTASLGVSNEGRVVGFFQDASSTPNHAPLELAGYWENGSWHHIDNISTGSMANCISPNGKLIGGIANVGGIYKPVVWNVETGEATIYKFFVNANGQGAAGIYAIADNGTAAGYEYHPQRMNRTPIIWETPNDTILPAYDRVGPFATANSISSDGTKVLVIDRIYDLTTHTAQQFVSFDNLFAFEFRGITNDGTVLGYTQTSMDDAAQASIVVNGQVISMSNYLKSRGLDFSAQYPSIAEPRGISDDKNVISVIAYDANAIPRSLAIRFGENTTTPAPVSLKAQPLAGASAVYLSWSAPVVKDAKPTGYELFRNGQSIYSGTDLSFVDLNQPEGTYTYTVKALYSGTASEASEAVTATLSNTLAASAPAALQGMQRGYNNVALAWEKPAPLTASYALSPANFAIYGMTGGIYSFESGVRFDSNILAAYSSKGQVVKGVSFYPMTPIKGWTLNLYDAADLQTPLYTQPIDASNFTYGQANFVALNTPFTAPAGKDIVVGIVSEVDENASNTSVQGFTYGWARPGYTDLMHRVNLTATTENFYSLHDYALTEGGADNSFIYDIAWPTALCFGDANTATAEAQSYAVYADGQKVATSAQPQCIVNNQPDGSHTYAVAAVYSNGTEGPKAEVGVTVAKNTTVYQPRIQSIQTNGAHVKATWDAVDADRNRTNIQYCDDTSAGGMLGSESNNWSYLVRSIYSSDMIRPFDGNQITALRFFPLAKADFTFTLHKNGEKVAEVEIPSYELNQWNEVKLPTPVTISRSDEYTLTLDMWDVDLGKAPLGRDSRVARSGESDLYSLDGETWKSVMDETNTTTGNWMIGLVAETSEGTPLQVNGYNVLLNNRAVNEAPLQTTSHEFDVANAGTYSLKVRALTDNGNFTSATKYFTVNLSGINDLKSDVALHVSRGTEAIRVEGAEVKALTLYNALGKVVAQAQGNTLSTRGIGFGTYVLAITTADGRQSSQKLAF